MLSFITLRNFFFLIFCCYFLLLLQKNLFFVGPVFKPFIDLFILPLTYSISWDFSYWLENPLKCNFTSPLKKIHFCSVEKWKWKLYKIRSMCTTRFSSFQAFERVFFFFLFVTWIVSVITWVLLKIVGKWFCCQLNHRVTKKKKIIKIPFKY